MTATFVVVVLLASLFCACLVFTEKHILRRFFRNQPLHLNDPPDQRRTRWHRSLFLLILSAAAMVLGTYVIADPARSST
jgi:hypothetical protein